MSKTQSNGGDGHEDIAVYDLTPDAPPARPLPMALGHLLLALGLALIVLGAWALASIDPAVAAENRAAREAAAQEAAAERAESAAGSGTGSDSGDADAAPGDAAWFDCNDDGTVCRFTSPEGTETYFCIEPCNLPPWTGEGTPVFGLEPGGTPLSFLNGPGGQLILLSSDHDEPEFLEFSIGDDGRINLRSTIEQGVPILSGELTAEPRVAGAADNDAQPAEPADGGEDESGDPGESGDAQPGSTDETESQTDTTPEPQDDSSAPDNATSDDDSGSPFTVFGPLAIILGAAFVLIAVAIFITNLRRRKDEDDGPTDAIHLQPPPPDAPQDEIQPDERQAAAAAAANARARKITDLIDELRSEPDPSLAIQRAYAALETGFGNPALARRPSETCATYLHRTIGVVGGVSDPLRTLTMLFELARFSDTPIDESMRADAIDALIVVRDAWRSRSARFGAGPDASDDGAAA